MTRIPTTLLALLTACAPVLEPTQAPPPTPGTLDLAVSPLTPGFNSTYTITGAPPGSTVYLGASGQAPGAGPCLNVAGGLCLDLVSPFLLGTTLADAAGDAVFALITPPSLSPGFDVTLQAVAIHGLRGADSASSDAIVTTVQALDPDADGDGFPASEDCDDTDRSIFPGAEEICDGIDNDCDELTEEAGGVTINGTDFGTLVDAINLAPSGAELLLCGGTHSLDEEILDRAITIEGVGPSRPVIRAVRDQILRAQAPVTFRHLEFRGGAGTILGNHAVRLECGNGVCYDSVIDDVIFEDNSRGALFAITESLTITDTIFRNNIGGGALHTGRGDILLDNVTITDNVNDYAGGGIRVEGGHVTLRNSAVLRNEAPIGGGAHVSAQLTSIDTDWGFGPADTNTPDDVMVFLSVPGGDSRDYASFGASESFYCTGYTMFGTLGCN